MPYQSDFVCTYKLLAEAESEEQHDLYQAQVLQALGVNEWQDETVNDVLEATYMQLRKKPALKQILSAATKAPNLEALVQAGSYAAGYQLAAEEIEMHVFATLFMFDYFDLFHRCLCELLNDGPDLEKHVDLLLAEMAKPVEHDPAQDDDDDDNVVEDVVNQEPEPAM